MPEQRYLCPESRYRLKTDWRYCYPDWRFKSARNIHYNTEIYLCRLSGMACRSSRNQHAGAFVNGIPFSRNLHGCEPHGSEVVQGRCV